MFSAEKLDLETRRLAKMGEMLALEALRDNMKNCGVFIYRDIRAYRGEETANLEDRIRDHMIYFEIFQGDFHN